MRQQGSHYYRRDSRIRAFAGRLQERPYRDAADWTQRWLVYTGIPTVVLTAAQDELVRLGQERRRTNG